MPIIFYFSHILSSFVVHGMKAHTLKVRCMSTFTQRTKDLNPNEKECLHLFKLHYITSNELAYIILKKLFIISLHLVYFIVSISLFKPCESKWNKENLNVLLHF